ncbi:MAG: hypothetical protein DI598_11450, partial [Pseudopedobacter saltans]
GRRVEDFPRSCIFTASTNNFSFLKDPTGNRRFWPIPTNPDKALKNPLNDLPFERDQIWAEAFLLPLWVPRILLNCGKSS